jgi:hypothetical protein
MNAPHLAKPTQPARRQLLPGNTPDLPAGWRRFASPARGLTFRYPSGWTIARQANYIFMSTASSCAEEDKPADEAYCEMVLDLTPVHLYPYSDLQDYMDRTHKRLSAEENEVVPISGGYLVTCQQRPCSAGKEFFHYYIGRGNLAYTLTVSGRNLPKAIQEIITSIRFS